MKERKREGAKPGGGGGEVEGCGGGDYKLKNVEY